ncbi:restriction endonuclease [Streptomyces sp. NPDC048258]|uniref:restriction endonuclease n=1 Tax=Streptomyces sp. NPDC048258 TaxID=3365527 RepID=UPI003711C8F5
MHINWPTPVTMPEYPSPQLQEALRRHISEATDDDLLAAHLHWVEGQVAMDWFGAADDLATQLKTELEGVNALLPPTNSPFAEDYHVAHTALREVLNQARNTAVKARTEARGVWRRMLEQTTSDVAAKYRRGSAPADAAANSLGNLRGKLTQAAQDASDARARHRNAMHQLALLEAEMDRFLDTDDSICLDDIHAMTPAAFEQAVAALARRDGFRIVREGGGARDLGADVIAVTPDSLRIVFQCKHRQAGLKKVGSPEIQTLNGTARPEHRADIVVAVTNGTFTKPAADFAHDHDIHLVDQARLNRWARWGEPLMAVLGLEETGSRIALSHRRRGASVGVGRG